MRLAAGDPDTVEIRFFDADGRDIDPAMQRKVERLLYREDFRRAFGGDIGDIVFPPRSLEFYTAALERIVDIDQVRQQLVQDRARLLVRRGVDRDAEPAHQARRRGARGEPVREHARGHVDRRSRATRRWPRLAELVRASGSDLGFVIDPEGELADRRSTTPATSSSPRSCCSRSCALIEEAVPDAQRRGAGQRHQRGREDPRRRDAVVRTRSWGREPHGDRGCPSVTFAGTPDGGCIWPDFLPAYDAAVTLVKLLDLLAPVDRPLSHGRARRCPSIHVAHETIVTPWERKGTVMREIVERAGHREVELIDGVKIIDDDRWALVLPDPEEALTHVWAEAGSDHRRRAGSRRSTSQRIRQILR